MTALERLKEKIESWKSNYEKMAAENAELKKELENCGGGSSEELESLKAALREKESRIEALEQEIEEKDVEIESIIANVEALLD